MADQRTNILLNNRRPFTARQSIDALVNFARYQSLDAATRTKKYISSIKNSPMARFWRRLPYSFCQSAMWLMYAWRKVVIHNGLLAKDLLNKFPVDSNRGNRGERAGVFCARDVPEGTRNPQNRAGLERHRGTQDAVQKGTQSLMNILTISYHITSSFGLIN